MKSGSALSTVTSFTLIPKSRSRDMANVVLKQAGIKELID
jgi:hypothetical protein